MTQAIAPTLDPAGGQPPVHDALALTAGGVTAHIRLGDCTYILRITRQGRLILTK
jgi:hypothetical protein